MGFRIRSSLVPVVVLAVSMPVFAGSDRGASLAATSAAPPAVKVRRDVLRRCLAGLDLSADQKSQIETYLESQKGAVSALSQTLEADREVLRAALESGSTDACALGADLLTIQTDRQALRTELDQVKSGVEGFLTSDQKTRFEGCLDAYRPLDGSSDF